MTPDRYTIDFQPVGRRGECKEGESLLDCARRFSIGINSVCGGAGTCGNCKIRVLSGTVSAATSQEREFLSVQEIKKGWRLACQAFPHGDIKLEIPPESLSTPQRTQVEGLVVTAHPLPPVDSYHLKIAEPSLADLRGDADRLLATLNKQAALPCEFIDFGVMRGLSDNLRALNWECQATVRGKEVVAIGPFPGAELGFAVDLGTTKIAGYLLDLKDGRPLASLGITNPQVSYGDDIISRMTFALGSPENARQIQQAVIDALNGMVEKLCTVAHVKSTEILEAVVVGNTAMHHLFLGLPVHQLSRSPFVPAVSSALDVKASNLGLNIATGAYVHLLPNIAGFVGADHVAALLAVKPWRFRGAVITIDIGTNTEVSLAKDGAITAVSCASGPAFEGGHISYGMRATPGAIERVRIEGNSVQYQTINGTPPAGICGSGILDALAQMYLTSAIDERGRMVESHPRVCAGEKGLAFLLAERGDEKPIVITQQDVRELQLAKAAMRTGIQSLLEAQHIEEHDVRHIIVAGAFGSYIDIASAVTVGMLPSLPLNRFRQVGNAAGTGARLALISLKQRKVAQSIAGRARYLELASVPGFMQILAQATYLGEYRIKDGKRVKV